MIEDVILTTENCRYCLMCRHIAPVEQVTALETHSPHGWALLVASQRRGLIDWDEEAIQALYSAPDGGNSRAHCVTDQPLPAALAAVRAEIAAQGKAPGIVYTIQKALEKWGTPHTYDAPTPVEGTGDVALFVGDEAAYLWPPDELDAALKLLAAVGIEPVLIGRGRNSGLLASSLGLPDTARTLAQDNIAELTQTGASTLLVFSPGDCFTFNQLYDERLGIEMPGGVTVREVTTLLAEKLHAGELTFTRSSDRTPWAYIDPTHAVRIPGRHDDPRDLLAAVMATPGRELFWRRERAHPVGSTYLHFTNQAIAARLTMARLEDAKRAGAQYLITEDPGTLFQLNVHTGKLGLKEQGLYSLLAPQLA